LVALVNSNLATRWAWITLATLALLIWAVLNRYRVERCNTIVFEGEAVERSACYILNRWSGKVEFRIVPTTGSSEDLRTHPRAVPREDSVVAHDTTKVM
jgi:hypothetical protein